MRPFGWDLPPGVRMSDIGGDDYVCERCGKTFSEEMSNNGEEQFCRGCAQKNEEDDDE